jgi:hypothetical protein
MEALIICTEIHHTVPQYLLRLRDRAVADPLDGHGIQYWLEFAYEAMRYGVDSDISRADLAAAIDASTVSRAARSTVVCRESRRCCRRAGD